MKRPPKRCQSCRTVKVLTAAPQAFIASVAFFAGVYLIAAKRGHRKRGSGYKVRGVTKRLHCGCSPRAKCTA